MYLNRVVKIPEMKGKIGFRKYQDQKYVQYVVGRRYDPLKKYTVAERVIIGIQIPARPEYMIPNENYFAYCMGGEDGMNEKEPEVLTGFDFERQRAFMIRNFFEQIYYEFQHQCRRQPDTVLNGYKVRKLNMILEPLKEMMKEEPTAEWLEMIPAPVEETVEGGGTVMCGMTYSDVMMILTQYRCVEATFFQKMVLAK